MYELCTNINIYLKINRNNLQWGHYYSYVYAVSGEIILLNIYKDNIASVPPFLYYNLLMQLLRQDVTSEVGVFIEAVNTYHPMFHCAPYHKTISEVCCNVRCVVMLGVLIIPTQTFHPSIFLLTICLTICCLIILLIILSMALYPITYKYENESLIWCTWIAISQYV